MEIRVLSAFLLCLVLQMVLWLDGPAWIAAIIGEVEQPHLLSTLFIALLAAVESLLLLLYFISERAILAGAISDHIGMIERAILLLFSRHPEQQFQAPEILRGEENRRHHIYRDGLFRAAKIIAVGVLLAVVMLGVLGHAALNTWGGGI